MITECPEWLKSKEFSMLQWIHLIKRDNFFLQGCALLDLMSSALSRFQPIIKCSSGYIFPLYFFITAISEDAHNGTLQHFPF